MDLTKRGSIQNVRPKLDGELVEIEEHAFGEVALEEVDVDIERAPSLKRPSGPGRGDNDEIPMDQSNKYDPVIIQEEFFKLFKLINKADDTNDDLKEYLKNL